MVSRVSAAFDKLTPREREILRLIAAHLQSKEIARALNLSPKTVEMHVLSARRRLSGMSRRDAALAFVAWEGGDPGSDYRKQPDGLAALTEPPLPDHEIGTGDERATAREPDFQQTSERGLPSGQLGVAEGAPRAAGRGRLESHRSVGATQVPSQWRTAFKDLVEGPDDGLSDRRPAARRDWRHELSNLQWLGMVLGITTVIAVALAVIAISVHALIVAIQHITHR